MEPLILWCTPYTTGGVTAFCANLQLATGWPMVRLAAKSMKPEKHIPGWGVPYHMRSLEDLIDDPAPLLLAGGSWKWKDWHHWRRLARRKGGFWWVFHDSTEFKSMPHLTRGTGVFDWPAIVLRASNLEHVPHATRCPQPYHPRFTDAGTGRRERIAVCTSRVDAMKQSHMIVEANRKLPQELQVYMSGQPNRMYVFSKKAKYPELAEITPRPPGPHSGAELCRTAFFSVDLTLIPGDGGGLQYTTLEAIDAGAIPVVHSGWMEHAGPMHDLETIDVSSADDLAELLQDGPLMRGDYFKGARERNRLYLIAHHGHATVKTAFLNAMR